MADSKITALTSIGTSTDPSLDQMVIVDTSDGSMAATGTTKKVSLNQLLSSNPSATGGLTLSGALAAGSATITGDLTVDTSTLKVDSANNRVIVGHTSGSSPFQVTNAGAAGLEIQPTGFSSAPLILSYNRSGPAYTQLTLDGSTIVHALSGSAAMTLNSNGLGLGVTPSAWNYGKVIEFGGGSIFTDSGNNECSISQGAYNNAGWKYKYTGLAVGLASNYLGTHVWYTAPSGTAGNAITWTQAMTLDASGNLLVGPTSANASGGCLQLKSGITFPATQVASSDANTLDDYEEGTWTPTIAAETGTIGTTVVNSANYTKIGRLVSVTFDITITSAGTGSDGLKVSLPFSPAVAGNTCGSVREYINSGDMGQVFKYDATNVLVYRYNNTTFIANGNKLMAGYTYYV